MISGSDGRASMDGGLSEPVLKSGRPWTGSLLTRNGQPSSPLRRATKPTGRTFALQDHRVRAAVRQLPKNVACASGAQPRDSAGPIRAQPLYADSISTSVGTGLARMKFSLFLVIGVQTLERAPDDPGTMKLVLPKSGDRGLQQAVGATDIRRYHTIGVFRWSRTFPRSPQGRFPRMTWPGAPQLRSGLLPPLRQTSCTSRTPSSSTFVCWETAPQRRRSRNRPFHAPIGMPAARQHKARI
jgi:hypothetical protein